MAASSVADLPLVRAWSSAEVCVGACGAGLGSFGGVGVSLESLRAVLAVVAGADVVSVTAGAVAFAVAAWAASGKPLRALATRRAAKAPADNLRIR